MVQPITPIHLTQAGSTPSLTPTMLSNSDAVPGTSLGRNAPGSAVPSAGSSPRVNPLDSQLAQLLQSAGDNIQSDRLLRLLLSLVILLSLLDSMNQQNPQSSGLGSLGSGQGDRSQFVGIFTSSTTISIEQTSTTVIVNPGGSGLNQTMEPSSPQGTRLDVSG